MNPLELLYGSAVLARNHLYERQFLAARRLQGMVISVGNLRVGGSGKTPFVILLGELLKQRRVVFDVLSRGYRRATKGVALVDPAGTPEQFGDEPLLIARKLGVPVIVGESRYEAGQFAEKELGPHLHLLDDGFQHRSLWRDFDIVLLRPEDLNDSLLPFGRLREPLSALSRADAVVLGEGAGAGENKIVNRRIWRARRSLLVPKIGGPAIAFCGIARPEDFFAQLRSAGVKLAATKAFRDHHRYDDQDVQQLMHLRQKHDAAGFVTTEKDAVNLGAHQQRLTPTHIVVLRMELADADAALDAMFRVMAERKLHPA